MIYLNTVHQTKPNQNLCNVKELLSVRDESFPSPRKIDVWSQTWTVKFETYMICLGISLTEFKTLFLSKHAKDWGTE